MPEFPGRLRTPRLPSAPSAPAQGEMYYDTGTSTLYWWNGTAWKSASGGSAAPEVYIAPGAPSPRDQQVIWVDTDESPPAVTRDINMDVWHIVGNPGEPAFTGTWTTVGVGMRFRKDPGGRVYVYGQAGGGTADTTMFTLPAGYRPPRAFIFDMLSGGGAAGGYVQVNADGTVVPHVVGGYHDFSFDTESVLQTASVAAQPMEPWHTVGAAGEPVLQNSWVNYGSGYQLTTFRKDPFGKVQIRGLLTGGTPGAAVPGPGVAFTLPAGYRPTNRVTAAGSLGGTPAQRLDVMSSGEVVMYSVGPGLPMGLDLIEFDTDTVSGYSMGAIIPSAQSMPVSMDSMHIVGAAGEPAFGTGWANLGGAAAVGFRKTPEGRVFLRGQIQATIAQGTWTTLFTLPVGSRPPASVQFDTMGPVGTMIRIDVATTGVISQSGAVASGGVILLDGLSFDTETTLVTASVAVQPIDSWHTVGNPGEPAFQNAWTHYDGRVARFRKYPDGRVRLVGLIKSGPINSVAFTLPAGYRPATPAELYFPCVTNGVFCQVNINPNGNVVVGATFAVWLDLSGIEFDTETVSNYATAVAQLNSPAKVTALPVSPVDGQEIYYVADAANGILWHLRYNAGSASPYKWEVVGGSDLYAEVVANESTTSTTYADLTTVGPAVALPLAGDYDVEIGAKMAGSGDAVNVYMSYAIGATAASDIDLINRQVNGAGYSAPHDARLRRKTGLTAVTLTAKYKVGNLTGTFGYRWMRVRPVRVG